MRLSLAIGAGLLAFAAASAPASALSSFGATAQTALTTSADASPLTDVHYRHGACRLGPAGWHRSYRWGRVSCAQPWRGHHRYNRHHSRRY